MTPEDPTPAREPVTLDELPIPLDEWVFERLENSIRIAGQRAGTDRDGWLEDVAYWRLILATLQQHKLLTSDQELAGIKEMTAKALAYGDELVKLRQQHKRALAALKPFAQIADASDRNDARRDEMYRKGGFVPGPPRSDGHRVSISLGECRAARDALTTFDTAEPSEPNRAQQ